MKPIGIPILCAVWLIALVVILLSGCASERYLSAEEDAEFRANCEAKGCTIVPNDVMREIVKRLRGTAI